MMTLKIIREGEPACMGAVNTPDDVYKAMKFIETADREKFYVLHLNAKNVIQAIELISMGSLTRSETHPREVFKGAILNNSTSIILVHNHPSGDPEPSEDDITFTRNLTAAADIVGIKILDHVIIGYERFDSLMEKKWIHELATARVNEMQDRYKDKKQNRRPANVLELKQSKSKNHKKTDNKLPPCLAELLKKVEFIYYEGTLDEKCKVFGTIGAIFDEIFYKKKSNQRTS